MRGVRPCVLAVGQALETPCSSFLYGFYGCNL